jgi:hypothetical protein
VLNLNFYIYTLLMMTHITIQNISSVPGVAPQSIPLSRIITILTSVTIDLITLTWNSCPDLELYNVYSFESDLFHLMYVHGLINVSRYISVELPFSLLLFIPLIP